MFGGVGVGSYSSWQRLERFATPKEEATSSVFIFQGQKRVDSLLGEGRYLEKTTMRGSQTVRFVML